MTTYTDIILQDTSNNYFIPYGLINRLGDVDISNPTTGQNLTYDATSGKWKNTSTSATVAWGGITGTLSDQTDLTNALNGKQDTLVSGTNIKTINNTSLLGSGDISVLQNTATGTNALTLLGTATSSAYSINIGNLSSISGMNNIAIGSDVSVTGQGSTAIGSSSYVTANAAIQIGTGTNSTDYSLNVGFVGYGNYQLLNGATGLIPDARISSNIARTSAIPTQASDISAADTTLSNVSSIDSNSAVQTALDGKANTSLSNLSATGKTVIDGQWVTKKSTLSTSTAVGSYPISLSSYLPNDGYSYEVIIHLLGTRSNMATTVTTVAVMSSYITSEVSYLRYNNQNSGDCNVCIIPVGTDRKITFKITGLALSSSSFDALAYRRIGSNS